MKDKAWQKPELVVLLRSRPEEAVLTVCKVETTPSGAQLAPSFNTFKGCWDSTRPPTDCSQTCQSRGGGAS